MNIKYFIAFITLFIAGVGFSQDKTLKVYLSEGQFYTPETGMYIETQLYFMGHSLNYVERDTHLLAEIEIKHEFSQEDSIFISDHYLLNSPIVQDSMVQDFHEIQKYSLSPGTYKYTLSVKDINSEKEALSVSKLIEIEDLSQELSFSTLIPAELIKPNLETQNVFTRMGYDVVPMLGNYYPTELQNMLYYVEVYNTDKALNDSVFVIEQKIISKDRKIEFDQFNRYYRYNSTPLQPVSKVIDISMLPTGSYSLELNILNRDKEVEAQLTFDFDRNNTDEVNEIAYESVVLDPAFAESIPEDSSGYYVASLIPISNQGEVKNIIRLLKKKDREQNFKYLQAFWKQVNPSNPYEAWIQYKAQVQLVERLFATNYQVGFETDRGRVFLQYGSPSNIVEQPSSPSEYPYEIWQYDKIKHYSNRRFVFYSPANLGHDYQLLHSDMIGEVQNPRWRFALNKRNTPDSNLDDPTGGSQPHFGGNSSLYYNSY